MPKRLAGELKMKKVKGKRTMNALLPLTFALYF